MAVTSQMRTKNGRIKPATKSIQAEPQYQSNELPRKSKQNPSKCTFRFFTRSPSFCHNQLIYKRNAHIYSYPILYISFFCPYLQLEYLHYLTGNSADTLYSKLCMPVLPTIFTKNKKVTTRSL